MANLPPLARLRLGASTGNGADSDEEYAHEPLDRRAYRKFPKLAPAPDVTTLAKMPLEVIEILIGKKAIAARDEDEPARAMCEWMKALCQTAKLAGVAGCVDHWYYLALAAFGFTPAPTEVAGEAPTLPAYSAFPNWHTFFGALCEAFYGTGVKRRDGNVSHSREWLKGEDAFFRYVRYKVYGNMGEGNDISPAFLKRFLDPNATQRALDTRLDELLDGELERRTWAQADREAAGNPYQAASLRESRTSRMRTQERNRFNLSFVHWINELDSELSADASPWAAVVTLFLLRGAKPWQEEKYRKADRTLWAITNAWALYEDGITGNFNQVGPLTPDEYRAKSLAYVRKSLDEGADPNFYHPEFRDPIMHAALRTRNEEVLALMFAHGVLVPTDSGIASMVFDTAVSMMFQAPTMGKPWPYSEDTTERLIAMLVAYWVGLTVPAQRRTTLTRIQGYVLHPSEQTPVWLCDLWKQMLPNIQSNSITV